jgi:hypothetical protein
MPDQQEFTASFLNDVFEMFEAYVSLDELRTVIEETTYEAIRAALSGATHEEVIAVAQEKAAALVTRVSEEMRAQMAEKIAQGLEQQLGPEGTARLLRDGLGLDSQREVRLLKYRESLEARGIAGEKLERMVEKERLGLISERARTIAQNEIGTALEEGGYVRAKAEGKTHKVWITSGTNRVCSHCEAAQKEGVVKLDHTFATGSRTPPAHPRCYCTVSYVADAGDGAEVAWAKNFSEGLNAELAAARQAAEESEE